MEERPAPSRFSPDLLVLLLIAALTRFTGIFHPRAVVYDEALYEYYIGSYFSGKFYFNVHPPLGNLVYYWFAKLIGFDGAAMVAGQPAVPLRLVHALAGTLVVAVFWWMMRELGASRRVAFLAGFLVAIDNALVVDSRFILIDQFLTLFVFLAPTLYLSARRHTGRARLWRIFGVAVVSGLAISIKWTGLSALGLSGIVWLLDAAKRPFQWRRLLPEALVLAAIPLAVYVLPFAPHFDKLTKSGNGDVLTMNYFQATLEGSHYYDPKAQRHFVRDFRMLNDRMMHTNAIMNTDVHVYATPWYSWPAMWRVFYMYGSGKLPGDRDARLQLLGNPVVWYGTLIALLVLIVAVARDRRRFAGYGWPLLFLVGGWAINYLPFAPIHRPLFLYSYFNSLIFSVGFAVFGVGIVLGWQDDAGAPWSLPALRRSRMYVAWAAAAVIGFAFFMPLTYGWPMRHDNRLYHWALPVKDSVEIEAIKDSIRKGLR
ncbi:MAG: dolichyl-phosphate-mannose-protein mannosyltransferase [Gemmatimonadetes bacterium]|nr:dolichyl-phosphate-mannose-protein mannosyltransferase [Gemmatimonadota bacterium]